MKINAYKLEIATLKEMCYLHLNLYLFNNWHFKQCARRRISVVSEGPWRLPACEAVSCPWLPLCSRINLPWPMMDPRPRRARVRPDSALRILWPFLCLLFITRSAAVTQPQYCQSQSQKVSSLVTTIGEKSEHVITPSPVNLIYYKIITWGRKGLIVDMLIVQFFTLYPPWHISLVL